MKINENIASCCGELRSMYGTVSLRVPIEIENSIQPHYPVRKYPLKIDFHDFERFRATVVRGMLRRQPYRTRYCG